MNAYEWIMIMFTGVIAFSTAIYTYFSHKLWKATNFSCEIARYSTFMTYLKLLADEAEKLRQKSPEMAAFYDQIGTLVSEVAIERFLEDLDLSKNPEVRDYFNKVEGMFRGKGIDPQLIPWMRPILKKMENNK